MGETFFVHDELCIPWICFQINTIISFQIAGDVAERWKRQAKDDDAPKKEESFEQELCKDKDAGEWFRLVAGDGDNCRDVIQCTSSVSNRDVAVVFILSAGHAVVVGTWLIVRTTFSRQLSIANYK